MELPLKETLPQLVRRALAPTREHAVAERVERAWIATSSAALLQRVENAACAIRGAGLCPGDRIALVSHNCVDWIVSDFAILFAGCVVVPMYPTQALDHTAHILQHSGAKLVFADTQATLARLRESGAPLPPAIVFGAGGDDGMDAFESRGASVRAGRPELPAAYEATLHPDDLAVLIYTSGTTGSPKGVMLSHDNIAFDAQSALECGLDDLVVDSAVLSILPYSHIYEHTMLYIYLLAMVRYSICHDPNELLADMREVRPTVMTSVPRIFDRVLAGVKGHAMKAGGAQAKLIPWALAVGREYMRAKIFGRPSVGLAVAYALARRIVLQKVRANLGLDAMKFFVSGSAALHVDTAMTFLGMGIPIMQGYGLTETSPVITTSRLSANEYGAAGRPIPGVELRVAPDGEILTRGRHVMRGYYRDPEATASAIVDGWFHTGDIGEVDAAGYLRITDRKREVFKTDTGKWISPARVEAAIKRSVFVSQAMVVGNGRPHPAALVAPNWDLLRIRLTLPAGIPTEELAKREDVHTFLTEIVAKQTRELASFEQVRRVVVVPHEFSVESGELSPSMKIKRRVVEERYAGEIDRAYGRQLPSHAPVA
ncbi:MAG: long-chain fatty acid--CoA ligase [Candidatus Eremiobacteraeota bacterium]|nr:long-chain fatty acid--CoA ligase [Candidatus Eremiobacteraeota bacterium]